MSHDTHWLRLHLEPRYTAEAISLQHLEQTYLHTGSIECLLILLYPCGLVLYNSATLLV